MEPRFCPIILKLVPWTTEEALREVTAAPFPADGLTSTEQLVETDWLFDYSQIFGVGKIRGGGSESCVQT